MKYCSDNPYPKVQVEKKNLEYAKILLFPYAGNVSEETAVHQYLYQSFILDGELSKILEQISIVEMHHIEILAETIKLLGIDPKYRVYSLEEEKYWSSAYVPYPKTTVDMLKQNIQSETEAIQNYYKIIELIDDHYIQNSIKRIIEDEQIHLTIFNNLLKEYEKSSI